MSKRQPVETALYGNRDSRVHPTYAQKMEALDYYAIALSRSYLALRSVFSWHEEDAYVDAMYAARYARKAQRLLGLEPDGDPE